MGQGSVDLQRLLRLFELRLTLEVGEGTHVVQPIGELDDNDPHVLAHRHDHLPQRLGLGLFQISRRQAL